MFRFVLRLQSYLAGASELNNGSLFTISLYSFDIAVLLLLLAQPRKVYSINAARTQMIQHKTSKVFLDSFSLLGENYKGYIERAVFCKANIDEDSCTADGCIFPIEEVMITQTSRSQLAKDRS